MESNDIRLIVEESDGPLIPSTAQVGPQQKPRIYTYFKIKYLVLVALVVRFRCPFPDSESIKYGIPPDLSPEGTQKNVNCRKGIFVSPFIEIRVHCKFLFSDLDGVLKFE